MHDDMLERRLREALHQEADVLPLTITAAELDRRLALRRRSFAGRRLTVLLAAAVGISLVGVGGALGGLFSPSKPEPSSPMTAETSESPPRANLATLDQLVAVDPASVLFAQAHGPTGGPDPQLRRYELAPGRVNVGTLPSGSRISVACLGPSTLELELGAPDGSSTAAEPAVGCDGTTHEATLGTREPQLLGFRLSGDASWRIVVRGQWGPVTLPLLPDPIFETPAGQEELVRLDDITVDDSGQPWGVSNLDIREIGAAPPRQSFLVKAWCRSASPIRYVLGSPVDGVIVPDTETQVACGPSGTWTTDLGIAQPNGTEVYLAAEPDSRVSFLITSATPPIALTESLPGWRISGGIGPDLAFDTHGMSFSGAGVGEDHVQVVLACTGMEPIEVIVEDGKLIGSHTQKFEATCSPAGATTSEIFKVTEGGMGARYVAPKGSWTALSILVPSN
jgi:hypothetical protein